MAPVTKNGNGNGGNSGPLIPIGVASAIILVLLETISYLAWSTSNSNMERIEKQAASRIQALEARFAERVLLVEKEFLRLREHDEFTRRLDSQITKMEARLGEAATRTELDTRLGINSGSIIQVRNDIDKLKSDLGQAYPMKEVLGNIQSRIDRMEQWSRAPPPHQAK